MDYMENQYQKLIHFVSCSNFCQFFYGANGSAHANDKIVVLFEESDNLWDNHKLKKVRIGMKIKTTKRKSKNKMLVWEGKL